MSINTGIGYRIPIKVLKGQLVENWKFKHTSPYPTYQGFADKFDIKTHWICSIDGWHEVGCRCNKIYEQGKVAISALFHK